MTQALLKNLQDGLSVDLLAFLPELIVCGTIVLLLFVRLFPGFDRWNLAGLAVVMTLCAFFVTLNQWAGSESLNPRPGPAAGQPLPFFSGLLVFDNFTLFLKLFLLGFAVLVILLCHFTGIPDREDSADFLCLLLGATLGMSLMASANHLLMIFIGVEMASVPSYALAGFLKGKRQSSEAALKYVVYGGGAAGIMLYGISLVAGKFGTGK